jgi:amino acid transporter
VFQTSGAILAITGPGGLLTACAIIGTVAILVMEGLSEMVELWPISNAMVEFVKRFVDKDLGTVVGIAYW